MTLYQFNLLDPDDRLSAVWQYGNFLTTRSEGEFQIVLYSINTFFVEVYYHIFLEEIQKHRSFHALHLLEPFVPADLLKELPLKQ